MTAEAHGGEVREACERALENPDLRSAAEALRRTAIDPPDSRAILGLVTEAEGGQSSVLELRDTLHRHGFSMPGALERLLLVRAALQVIDEIPTLPVSEVVKERLYQALLTFAAPPDRLLASFDAGHYPFVAFAKIASLRRFPAGQFEWEVTGLPRSFFLRVRPLVMPRLAGFVLRELGGLGPLFMPHFSIFRKHWLVLREREVNLSYYRMAEAMKLQPSILGMLARSWFYAPDTYEVSPHLSWLRREIEENGGFTATIGHAPIDGGFLHHGTRRRQLYDARQFRPSDGLVIWPRKAMIRWAEAHPEFGP